MVSLAAADVSAFATVDVQASCSDRELRDRKIIGSMRFVRARSLGRVRFVPRFSSRAGCDARRLIAGLPHVHSRLTRVQIPGRPYEDRSSFGRRGSSCRLSCAEKGETLGRRTQIQGDVADGGGAGGEDDGHGDVICGLGTPVWLRWSRTVGDYCEVDSLSRSAIIEEDDLVNVAIADSRNRLDHQHGLRPTMLGRRHVAIASFVMMAIGVFSTAISGGYGGMGAALAVQSRPTRLSQVENPTVQAALRAAVSGNFKAAESMFSELISAAPDNASVWSNRGSVRMSMGRASDAAADFSRAIELAPYAPVPFLNRAIAFEALGRFDEALDDCNAAIKNDPEEFAAWFNRGNVEVKLENYPSALADYAKASDLAPGIAGYRLREALVLFQLNRGEEAVKLMQGLVRKYPNYAEAHAALAAVFWNGGETGAAEEQFSEATDVEPRLGDLRWVKAALGWPPGMVKAMEKFLTIK